MQFHVEEERSWVRTHTHTIVRDRDPDFERFRRDPTGTVERLVRVWLAEEEAGGRPPHLTAYLGSVHFFADGPERHELRRLLRRTATCARLAGQPPRRLRHRLTRELRRRIGG